MNERAAWFVFIAATSALVGTTSCGRTVGKTEIVAGRDAGQPNTETCNGLDDDRDGTVDESFRDEQGRYVNDEHCGACDIVCRPIGPRVTAAACALVDEAPACVATACMEGLVPSTRGTCVDPFQYLCLPCVDDTECGNVQDATCATFADEARCSVPCSLGCPDGYTCSDQDACVPAGGSCRCKAGSDFTLACALTDPKGLRCPGTATCTDGVLSECVVPDEVCDEVDNDCNGAIDEGFRDARGAYSLDVHNCGECGVDCTAGAPSGGELACGGDPFAPTCVFRCPDTENGLDVGDRVDADRNLANGCECTIASLDDEPGPAGASGNALDTNCDGADGIVVSGFYVAPDGDDTLLGSPTRPLRSISAAIERAAQSLATEDPRPHVFVSSGSYVETLHVPDGVQIHGGYRRDYLVLEPDGFKVEVRAPADTTSPGGAALEIRNAGARRTVVEWITLRGVDATERNAPAFGAYVIDPGSQLALRNIEIRAGVAGPGATGRDGSAGMSAAAQADNGEPPRAAAENNNHVCTNRSTNVVAGGDGGRSVCGEIDVTGGRGGSPSCPSFAAQQPSGENGLGPAVVAVGRGGEGGQDSQGPIFGGSGCDMAVCCGLADFSVPTEFVGPQAGGAGANGQAGAAGRGCTAPLGRFDGDRWVSATPTRGSAGTPGSGGGGGGAGGGAEMTFVDDVCEFADGLGGGGGGGGGGGCGGGGGNAGTSGGPSAALVVRYSLVTTDLPTIDDVVFAPGDGGHGGDGGAGGDGGLGGAGGFGGEARLEDRLTPTLAGPFPGARGGKGGNGGVGGGGGGGCSGGSIGIWLLGVGTTEPTDVARWRTDNTFRLGRAGTPGRGGSGGAPAAGGTAGTASNVVVQ